MANIAVSYFTEDGRYFVDETVTVPDEIAMLPVPERYAAIKDHIAHARKHQEMVAVVNQMVDDELVGAPFMLMPSA